MDSAEFWRTMFTHWPEHIERRGFVLSKQGESIGFDNFLVSPGILLLERNSPDASGARKAFIGYDSIALVKLPTTAQLAEFQAMGFRPPVPRNATKPPPPAPRPE